MAAIGRRTGSGAWVSVFPGVYRAASTPESWHQKLMAACLWAGDGAVVSHRTAARLRGLEGLSGSKRYEPIELTVPLGKQLRASGVLVHQSRALERTDRTVIDGIPVTSLARTLIDLSAMLDAKHLGMALDSGLALHTSVDVGMIRSALRRLKAKGRPGLRALERLLAARAPDAVHLDSALERWFSNALRRARLPRPVEHYDVIVNGRRTAELDFAYPRLQLGIQLKGASIHRRHGVWKRDLAQESQLAAAGWRILSFTWEDLRDDEAGTMKIVARALEFSSH
jgi:hypothetical protein